SPLAMEGGAAEANVYAAQNGVPVAPMSLSLMGSTSPVTFAGNTVLTNAEELMCYMMVKCANEDAAFIYTADSGAPNMSNLAYNYNNPEYLLTGAADADMARYYGMPNFVVSGTGEWKDFSSYCGFERNIYKAAMAYMTRTDLSCSFGSLDNCLSSSFAEVMLDTEAYRLAKAYLRSYEINEDKLAAEVIDQIGPHGNFLECEHTFRHFKEEVSTYNRDVQKSFVFDATSDKDYREVAQEQAEKIWATHEVPAIAEDLQKEMEILRSKAYKDLVGE
ncbi:MAG: trimethylamine methyltransferase family protein, partial [Clostridiales bacterium]